MKVKELIDILSKLDKNMNISIWDAYHDNPTREVHVSELYNCIHIDKIGFGGKEFT